MHSTEPSKTSEPDFVHVAERLLNDGEYRRVVELCESIQLRDEDLPRKFWFIKARALDELGEFSEAIGAYRCEMASLARVPPDVLGRVGALLGKLGRGREAAQCLAQSCEISPSSERLILLASELYRLGDTELARSKLRYALNIEPANDEAWHNLGAYLLDEDPAEAEHAFRRALEIDASRADTYAGLAMSYLDQLRTDEAIDAARAALALNPSNGIGHLVLGNAMGALGNFDAAEAALLKAFRFGGDRPSALIALAGVLERRGRLQEAASWYGRGLRAWPDDPAIRAAYVAFAAAHGDQTPELIELCKSLERTEREIDLARR